MRGEEHTRQFSARWSQVSLAGGVVVVGGEEPRDLQLTNQKWRLHRPRPPSSLFQPRFYPGSTHSRTLRTLRENLASWPPRRVGRRS